jgi:hypothetical protein
VPTLRSSLPPWVVTAVAGGVVLVAVLGAGAARGAVDPAAAAVAGASAVAAHAVAGLVGRRAAQLAERRLLAAFADAEGACAAQLESRRRSLSVLWPTSADLVERLRRGDPPRVVGAPSIVVLGTGAVASGVVLVGDEVADASARPRTEALRARVATLSDGPLCLDAAGGVHVRGPALLVDSLAGGYCAQLRHRGAPSELVTRQHTGAGPPPGGAGRVVEAACLVEISRQGAVVVVRRDGAPCSVPVTPSWTSALDAPGGTAGPVAAAPEAPGGPTIRPERP